MLLMGGFVVVVVVGFCFVFFFFFFVLFVFVDNCSPLKVFRIWSGCLKDLIFISLQDYTSQATQHLLGPIWATFSLLNSKTPHNSSIFFRRTAQVAPNFLHWNAHIFLFGLILRDIPNSITPQTPSACYRPRSDCLYSLVTARPYSLPPPPLFSLVPDRGTCARDRRALQLLALNVHVKHSDLTWPPFRPHYATISCIGRVYRQLY